MADLMFEVTGRSDSAARVIVRARQFTIVVDEPPSLGGEDRGANPVEYVLAALVGCANVMAHLIATEMGFVIKSLQVNASGTLNPAKLFGKTTSERPGYRQIDLKLIVSTDADQPTLTTWLATLRSRCPVSDNLVNPTPLSMDFEVAG